MRILNIQFKNINSLEGEGRVNFDQGPIADSGVFAITGPNGSGKTSILDVITLGLYGETFRFDKPAQHIITKHASDSYAQVEFAFNGEKFRSTWQVQRQHNTLPEMTLMRLNGSDEVLAETPAQVRNYLAELTGMDFHKFSKAIVLPQGDFAAFLNALDSERLDILEKISGTGLYDDYIAQITTRHHQLQEQTAALLKEQDLLPVLSDEALEATELDLQDFKEQNSELQAQQKILQQQLLGFQNIAVLESRHSQLSGQQQQLLVEVERHKADLQRILSMPQADSFQGDLQLLANMQTEAAESRNRLQNLQAEQDILHRQLQAAGVNVDTALPPDKSLVEQKQLIGNLKLKLSEIKLEIPRLNELEKAIVEQLANKKQSLLDVESWLQTNQLDAQLLSDFPDVVQLRNLRSALAELGGQQKSQFNWSKKTSNEQKKNHAAVASAQTRITELKAQIEANQQTMQQISQGKSLDELKTVQTEQDARLKDFEELFSLAGVNARFTEKKSLFGWLGGSSKELELPDPAGLQIQVDNLRAELAKEENIGRALEQAIDNEQILKKLSDQRNKLVDGKPCFLCGATQHPYTLKPPLLTDSKKALADQRGRTQLMRAKLSDVEKQYLLAQKRSTQLTAKQKFLQEKRAEWTTLSNRLNIVREGLDITNISMQEKLLLEEADELERIKKLVDEYTQLQRSIGKAKTEITEKQELLGKLRLSGEQLDENWAERSPETPGLEQKFKQLQAEEKALLAKLEAQLKLLGEKLPAKGKENATFDRLNTRRQDYQIRNLRLTGLGDEIAELQEKLHSCQAAIARYQQETLGQSAVLQQAEVDGMLLTLAEKQMHIAIQQQTLQEQQQTLEGLSHALSANILQQGFNNLQELENQLQLMAQQAQIQATVDEKMAHLIRLDQELLTLERQLHVEMTALGEGVNATDLQAMLKQLVTQQEITAQEIHTLDNKLEKQRQYRHKFQTLESELLAIQQQFAESATDIQLISEDQAGLRQRIQQLLIDKLLVRTNQILEKINGRYYVRQAESVQGLRLEIEDSKQQNARRLPKTLSGGESFVLSLALALALAEIANNGKAIESLFLDEGFGNLDADALYLAIGALEGLKTQGRTVGVISHVEGVKKRIKTQIELVKKPNGLSELKMVA